MRKRKEKEHGNNEFKIASGNSRQFNCRDESAFAKQKYKIPYYL